MADRNLLFGVLALQMDFIPRDALIDGIQIWIDDKQRPLGDILVERGHLTTEVVALLDALVRKHLEMHDNDPDKSLSSIQGETTPHPGAPEIEDFETRSTLEMVLGKVTAEMPQRELSHVPMPSRHARFHVLRPHAQGGLGRILVALDQDLQREVALKELKDEHAKDKHRHARFLLEAEVTGSLEHPGIVPVYALGACSDGRPYYAMRFIRGDSLRETIKAYHRQQREGAAEGEEPIALRQLLRRFVDVCNAISFAHSKSVIHRDVKPENVMLGPFGETLVVDWGLAKVQGETPSDPESTIDARGQMMRASTQAALVDTMDGTIMGTPAYVSPEQAEGRIDLVGPASDTYSLGATLYCLLTDKAPFEHGTFREVMDNVRKGLFPPPGKVNPKTPKALEAICLQAMATKPDDRYASVQELADDVERWVADEPVSVHPEPWITRAERWVRRHQTLVTTLAALLVAAVLALTISTIFVTRAWQQEEEARVAQALSMVNELRVANPQAVPTILESLRRERALVEPTLRDLWSHPDQLTRRERMRVGLALLPGGAEDVQEQLFEWMLDVDDPREMLLFRDGLTPYRDRWRAGLWTTVDAPNVSPRRRFNALVALAAMDSGNAKRWRAHAFHVVGNLLDADRLRLSVWSAALSPVHAHLLHPLKSIFQLGAPQHKHRQIAAELLAEHAGDNPDVLADLLPFADADQYAVLLPKMRQQRAAILPKLHQALAARPAADADPDDKEHLARRQANAALTLIHLGEPDLAWPLLADQTNPTRRSHLVHRLAPLGVPLDVVLDQLFRSAKHNVHARRALLLSLGGYVLTTQEQQDRLLKTLLEWYEKETDPGIHAAVDWLLRHDNEGPFGREFQLSAADKLRAVDDKLARQSPNVIAVGKKPGWHVTKSGVTLTVLPGPIEHTMGSPLSEPGRKPNEKQRRVTIGHSYAVASKEVTVRQFQEFLRDVKERYGIEITHRYDPSYSPSADGPIISITWYEAIQFCRWLSEKEGLPETEWCHPSIKEIEACRKAGRPVPLPDDFLSRTGYRLPTEDEWEYASRAGSGESRYFGSSDDLLDKYAWYVQTSHDRAWPVGQKRPNDFGLFDVHGNASEWCHNEIGQAGKSHHRALRGGAFAYRASSLRAALRDSDQPGHRFYTAGFRVARTCRNQKR